MTCKSELQNIMLRRLVSSAFIFCIQRPNSKTFQINVQLCEDGWEYMNGKCYKVIADLKTWEEAKENCKSLGGKLAEPQSPCESELLRHFFQIARPLGATDSIAYIGINDIDTEGKFVFASNDQDVPYEYWYQNEPNNAGDGGEDCVNLNYRHDIDKWNDINCSRKILSICEKRHEKE